MMTKAMTLGKAVADTYFEEIGRGLGRQPGDGAIELLENEGLRYFIAVHAEALGMSPDETADLAYGVQLGWLIACRQHEVNELNRSER